MKLKPLFAALVAGLLFTGCQTTGGHLDMSVACPLATTSAAIGSSIALQSYPQYRPAFIAARDGLTFAIAASGTNPITPASLTAILNSLPVKELHGTNTQSILIADGGLVLLNLAKNQVMRLDRNGAGTKDIVPLAACIRDGLSQTLGQ